LRLNESLILDHFVQAPQLRNLQDTISQSEKHIYLKGVNGSALSFLVAQLFKDLSRPFLFLMNDKEEAAYLLNDLELLVTKMPVLFYPGSYRRPYELEEIDNSNVLQRAEVLNRIQNNSKPYILVSYPDALFEKVVNKKDLKRATLKLKSGGGQSLDKLNETLFEFEFKRVDFVTEPGEFSLRGGILDIFSFSHDEPYRIEFFGDQIESIRTFDIETQLSIKKVNRIEVIPNVADKFRKEARVSFFEFLDPKTLLWFNNPDLTKDKLDRLYKKAVDAFSKIESPLSHMSPEQLFMKGTSLAKDLHSFTSIYLTEPATDQDTAEAKNTTVQFETTPQPVFNKNFDLLIENLRTNHERGLSNIICCASQQQADRLHEIFDEIVAEVPYKTLQLPIHAGFYSQELKIACYTDHQIFERYHKFQLRNSYAKKQAITLKELNKLEMGDYVTHIDHGIGKFGGLQKIDVEGKKQEAIKLMYGDRDILYVSIHSLHKISKYNGKDGAVPKIYKLGSAAWKKIKQKTKSRVKKIAFDLISVYAKRKMKEGFQYDPDSYLQHELEASFLYEDTPDQSKVTEEIKQDMESPRPMDRLVCGDVGFGKTEVAIRAAFKAVDNGKQVAILVPTTILAFQHHRTFTERLKNLPVSVDYLNRFRSAKEKREIISRLANGQLEIIIGTHQLVKPKIKFKNLGLLIVDEEQKFGVSVKEKLKSIKENVDVLTLTATPIPRTLQFSLMAARDLSVINTPPPNRYPIESRVIRFDQEVIRDAIHYEISRGGQVFFIHNRIQNIQEVGGLLQRLVPDARIRIGHGQLEGKKLERLMLDFMNGEFDVLVSTTIVESGLDVTNANTIFIHNANNFGLSDLHQMRGRVGRSNKKAFCYFITPPFESMSAEARKRITAVEQFTALGSGFNIAMKDLEIRGAGDLLGGEQSGFINEIGFETYQKILNEAIEELKENEFKDLYEVQEGRKGLSKELHLDADLELLFPDTYINNISERLHLYTQLNAVEDDVALAKFVLDLKDRFGDLPPRARDLVSSIRLKWVARSLGLEKLVLKKGKMLGYFIADQASPFYQSKMFTRVIKYVQKHPEECSIKEKETRKGLRLILRYDAIDSVDQALLSLRDLAGVTEDHPVASS